ncbi:lipoprotein [Paraburkholderia terrae]|uniref:Lipoprotein n=1 Tax=Paraburkholderia terrae TaxID=311230 RepID=A0ABM7TKJ0_9BURK|nr:CNP1-like family protein [Paraburkholderia terrae]BCZ79001.1 lipoprotein [Paraburkholderia terrae]
MKVFAFAAACVAAGVLLAGCSSTKSSTPTDASKSEGPKSDFQYLFDRPSTWTEKKVDTLPAMPQPGDLLPFTVSQNTPLQFALDAKSLTVDSDGVIRYTVVVTSPSGARNVNYEGIRCEDYSWKLYAGLNADHDGWDRTVGNDWSRIENGDLNAYHAALYQDYFCTSKLPVGKADAILNNIRYKRVNSTLIRGG